MPVSTLRCTAQRSHAGAGGAPRRARRCPAAVYTVGVEPLRDDAAAIASSGGSESTRTGRRCRRRAAATPSSTSATPSHVGAGLERGPRRPDRAVAVAVGLDDRAEPRRATRCVAASVDVVARARRDRPRPMVGRTDPRRLELSPSPLTMERRMSPGRSMPTSCRRRRRPAAARRRGRASAWRRPRASSSCTDRDRILGHHLADRGAERLVGAPRRTGASLRGARRSRRGTRSPSGSAAALSCTIRSPVGEHPDDLAVAVDHRRAVDAAVDQRSASRPRPLLVAARR